MQNYSTALILFCIFFDNCLGKSEVLYRGGVYIGQWNLEKNVQALWLLILLLALQTSEKFQVQKCIPKNMHHNIA